MKKFRKFLKDGAGEPIVAADEKLTQKDVTPERKGKKRRRILFKSMFVMSIIFVMISVSYSWFVQSNFARVTDVTVNVVDPKNVTTEDVFIVGQLSPIAGDGKNFFVPEIGETVLEFETESEELPEEVEDGEELVETEPEYIVSGYDKIGNTYSAILDDVTAETISSDNIKNVRVIQFTINMPGDAQKLCLMPGTSITPVGNAPSYLAGALRVSFLKKNAQNEFETVLIWIPDVTSTVKEGETELEAKYVFVSEEGTETVSLLVTDDTFDGASCEFGPIQDAIALGGEFSGEATFRCVIWLDGNDRECNADLINQQFTVNLNIQPESGS